MDAVPSYDFWWRLGAGLSVEVSLIALGVWAFEKFTRSAAWRRVLWHICVIGLIGLVAAELTGAGRLAVAQFREGHAAAESSRHTAAAATITMGPGAISETAWDELTLASEPQSRGTPTRSWIPGVLWVMGFTVVGLSAVLLRTLFAVAARWRCTPTTSDLVERANQLAGRLRLREPFAVIELPWIRTPVAFGIFRCKIGVPRGFSHIFTPAQQDVMLAHELAHLAGRDAAWHLLADVAVALLWWHPVAWWVRGRLHAATEFAADEASLIVRDGPAALAETLMTVGSSLMKTRHRGALGIKGWRSGLARRIARLMAMSNAEWRMLSPRASVLKFCLPLVLVAGVVACCAGVTGSMATPRDEWRNSVAARAYAALAQAAAQQADTDESRIQGFLSDAQTFFGAGKLDYAEGLCEEVLKIDGANQEALHLLDAIARARRAKLVENGAELRRPSVDEMERIAPKGTTNGHERFIAPQQVGSLDHVISNTVALSSRQRPRTWTPDHGKQSSVMNIAYQSQGRQRIARLLRDIRLPVLAFEHVPLPDVLKTLAEEIKERDPEKKGFQLILSKPPPPAPLDPATGEPFGPGRRFLDLEKISIQIVPTVSLHDLTLSQAFDAICEASEPKLRYSIEEYAVVFFPPSAGRPLHTRTYKIEPSMLVARLFDPPGRALDLGEPGNLIPPLLKEAGVDLAPPKAFFFNERLGILMIRATLEDHDVIDRALAPFVQVPRQMAIEVRLAEFRNAGRSVESVLGANSDGMILTDPQYRMVIRALEQAAKVDVFGPRRTHTVTHRGQRLDLPSTDAINANGTAMHLVSNGFGSRSVWLSIIVSGREPVSAAMRDQETLVVHLPPEKTVTADDAAAPVRTRIAFVTVTILEAAGR